MLDIKSRQTKTKIRETNTSSNEKIIEVLETVKSHYANKQDKIHVNAYERAIYQIKKWPHKITKGSDIAKLDGIGKGMVQKIDTILATGTLPIIKEYNLLISNKAYAKASKGTRKTKKSLIHIQSIDQVLGFNSKSIAQLEKQYDIKTVEELIKLAPTIKLTRIQQMGLRYHNDLQAKVPREEVSQIGNKIAEILNSERIMMFLAGSYPSGLKTESKDIDILLVARDSSKLKSKTYLEELVQKLQKQKTLPLETITVGANKFLGLVKLLHDNISPSVSPPSVSLDNPKWRHLDMRLVDMSSFPYSWLYYSSGVIFNKLIREKLKKKGYKLNEWGLFRNGSRVEIEGEQNNMQLEKVIHEKNDILEYAEKIEKEIFKLANLDYKSIRERY
jgi:DNA polymerase/3'-5' exonuclease PolX